jgi:hypothetical protein
MKEKNAVRYSTFHFERTKDELFKFLLLSPRNLNQSHEKIVEACIDGTMITKLELNR